ncbi:MAG: carboxymuconolactone decarboxylase family protein [Myxococcota bacterium]
MQRDAAQREATQREATQRDAAHGRAALELHAPRAGAALDALAAAAWRATRDAGVADLFDLASRVVASQHGAPPLARPAGLGTSPWHGVDAARWRELAALDDGARPALAFAEQLAFDVASLGAAERGALFASLGAAAGDFAQACYVADFAPRVRAALDALFGPSPAADGDARAADAPALTEAFDLWIRVVPQLREVDAVTTELVRLLGARRHRCRICQSLRSRAALVAGADDAMFDAVDRYAQSDLSPAHKAALAFAEAMISTPFAVDASRARALREQLPPAACVELVLDVARNATNKVAVALGGDAPRVESGYEVYDVGPDGELLYGLEAP